MSTRYDTDDLRFPEAIDAALIAECHTRAQHDPQRSRSLIVVDTICDLAPRVPAAHLRAYLYDKAPVLTVDDAARLTELWLREHFEAPSASLLSKLAPAPLTPELVRLIGGRALPARTLRQWARRRALRPVVFELIRHWLAHPEEFGPSGVVELQRSRDPDILALIQESGRAGEKPRRIPAWEVSLLERHEDPGPATHRVSLTDFNRELKQQFQHAGAYLDRGWTAKNLIPRLSPNRWLVILTQAPAQPLAAWLRLITPGEVGLLITPRQLVYDLRDERL